MEVVHQRIPLPSQREMGVQRSRKSLENLQLNRTRRKLEAREGSVHHKDDQLNLQMDNPRPLNLQLNQGQIP